MRVNEENYRTIWLDDSEVELCIIDQTELPHKFVIKQLSKVEHAANAIKHMQVRGAPLIGVTAAFGMYLAMLRDPSNYGIESAYELLLSTRPTAVNLRWALDQMKDKLLLTAEKQRINIAKIAATQLSDEDVELNQMIGEHGLNLLKQLSIEQDEVSPLRILTHCNAGWLATVDWGTALAPIYKAHDAGIPVHVLVDETRPRNQGASLTAWELGQHGVPHTIIADNAGGHLMQHGLVDLCIVGSDRTTSSGDVCNKIGTYLKALAAHDNDVPFYVAVPSSTIDWRISDGVKEIQIEERAPEELSVVKGVGESGEIIDVKIYPQGSDISNFSFDVTPAKYVTGLITERGICQASRNGLRSLFGDQSYV
ncbi:MAG: S-methyl-5-thioribose-1-phosphate isomerase [SAR202 cluster bacterium]|nr:S-methyl-5-thioribose-1-phosphate isomerase [SAR202 cluster bacterium]|tara:strand:- start:175 stop:1275 length:1101 start_codon:yes stop_codon:yes gene_type:complete